MKHYSPVALALAIAVSTAAHAETSLEERLAATEQRIKALESTKSDEQNISIKGFMTFSMERTSAEDATGADAEYRGSLGSDNSDLIKNQDWNLQHLTRAGVQINAQINDRTEAVIQVLGRANQNYEAEVQWAYVSYHLTPELTARAGRMVLPLFMHTQYNNVGYAYNWIQLPSEIYGIANVDTMEGVDLTWNTTTGNIAHSVNIFWGGQDLNREGTTYEVRDQHGINIRSSLGDISTWLSYSASETSLALPAPTPAILSLDHETGTNSSIGIQYDNGSLLMSAERTRLTLAAPFNWFPDLDSMYASVAYRLGKWTPIVTWAELEHSPFSDVDSAGIVFGAGALWANSAVVQRSWTFGTRYDLTPGVALKAEASNYYGFYSEDNAANKGLFTSKPDGDAHVYRLAVEAVF